MPTSPIKIIADCAILESLQRAFDGQAYQPGNLSTKDTLIIDVSASTSTLTTRTAYGGLRTIDRILSNPEEMFAGLVLVSFESKEALLASKASFPSIELIECEPPLLRPPFSLRQLEASSSSKIAAEIGQPKTWVGWLVRLKAVNRLLQWSNASYRHDHKNLIAAVRIYLGAMQAGVTDLDLAQDVLMALQSLEGPTALFASSVSPSELIMSCRNYRAIVSRIKKTKLRGASQAPKYRSSMQVYERQLNFDAQAKRSGPQQQILMLDDHYDSKGWELVLNTLIRKADSITFSRDWLSTQRLLVAPGNYFDVMLLDCNLGSANSTGLELLPALRSFSLDLPVFMMTAYDNSELALWALRAGCNGFYAKELEDNADRDSFDYFLRFSDILRRPTWEKEVRRLWKDFRQRLPPNDPDLIEEESRLRYAFYLLLSLADGMTWWTRGAARRLGSSENIEEFTYRNVVLALYASENMRFAVGEGLGKRARHMGHSIKIADALRALKASVSWFASQATKKTSPVIGQPNWPEGCRIPRAALIEDEDVARASLRLSKINLGHLERSRLGAVQLVLGFLALHEVPVKELEDLFREAPRDADTALELLDEFCQEKGIPQSSNGRTDARVVLIDDEGDINGWKRALEIVLGKNIEWHRDIESFLRGRTNLRNHADVILLDLWLKPSIDLEPSPEAGLKALDCLKERDLGLPVIVISAATDTVNAIRCMKRGALDYVAKWLAREDKPESWRHFAKTFLDRIQAGAQLGKSSLRRVWEDLDENLTRQSPLLMTPDILMRINNWTPPSSSAQVRVTSIRSSFAQQLLPALIVYQNKIVTDVSNGEIPPLDDWRVKDVLQVSKSADENIIFIAGRAAEYLGMMRCGLEAGRVLTTEEWIRKRGDYTYWIKRASPKAADIWKQRSRMKDILTKTAANPTAILKKIIDALREFEALATSQASAILRNR